MKKITFPVLFFLCLTLLSACGGEDYCSLPADPNAGGDAAPLNVTRDEAPEPDNGQPDSGGIIQPEDEPRAEKIPMLMLGGELYCDTGLVSTEARCGMMDGQIASSVEPWERPDQDGQSNFGSGYGWQSGRDAGTVEVNIDGEWRVFRKRSELRVRYCDDWFDAEDVSDETLRWLLWFNSLDEETQMCVSYTPLDLYELCGYPLAGDMPAVDAGE